MAIAQHCSSHVEWSGQTRSLELCANSALGDHFDGEVFQKNQAVVGTDGPKKLKRSVVAAHQNVLSIVDQIAGLAIGKRVRAAAQRWLAFKDGDPETPLAQRYASTEPSESPTNNDNVSSLGGQWKL